MKHSSTINAPADIVQRIISDAENWPIFFTPTVACERNRRDEAHEELRLWARKGELDTIVSWRSARQFSTDRRNVTFQQIEPAAPLTEMTGLWAIRDIDEKSTELTLSHTLAAADEDALRAAQTITDYNSTIELTNIKTLAETYGSTLSEHIVRTRDEVWIDADVHEVFMPLWEVSMWPDFLDHVAAVTVHSQETNQQRFSMELSRNAEHAHSVESVRVARPDQWIAFKQIQTPTGVYGHAGTWTFEEAGDGTRVIVRHLALLERTGDVSLSDLVTRLSASLSQSSLSTLAAIERMTA